MGQKLLWNSLKSWQKTMLIILAVVVLPITLIGIIAYLLFSNSNDTSSVAAEKWHHEQMKKRVEKSKAEINQNRDETRKLLKNREKELDKIEATNEEARDLLNDIDNASNANELDLIRERINNFNRQ